MRFFLLFTAVSFAQALAAQQSQITINEVSLGTQEGQQYAELLVLGSFQCTGVSAMDLRGMRFDDNNGAYSPNSTAGVSQGAIRFADMPFWSAVPTGTIIVIYNELNRNPAIPADDASLTDGNSVLVLPANSPLLEGNASAPNLTQTTMNTTGWVAGGGKWAYVYLDNAGDVFRVNYTTVANGGMNVYTAVSWGSNTGEAPTYTNYFNQQGAGKVFYSDYWIMGSAGGGFSGSAQTHQTPGQFNTTQNFNFYQQYGQAGASIPTVQLSVTGTSCAGMCDGLVSASVQGATGNVVYNWSAPGTGAQLSGLCPGTYSVTITDQAGCTATATASVQGAADYNFAVQTTGETCPGSCNGAAELNFADGPADLSLLWSTGSTAQDISGLCAGDYNLAISYGDACADTIDFSILTATPNPGTAFLSPTTISLAGGNVQLSNATPGGTYSTVDCAGCLSYSGVFNPVAAGTGTYEICYTLVSGQCTFTECSNFLVEGCLPDEISEERRICEGDSLLIFGNWERLQQTYSSVFTNEDGCDSVHTVTLSYYPLPDNTLTASFCEGDSVQVTGKWIDSAGVYFLEAVTGFGCSYQRKVIVEEIFCAGEVLLYIPNAFTPNGDEVNNAFRIEILGGRILEGYIYNRWGEVVARFDENALSWDGRNLSGQEVPDGVYAFMLRYSQDGGNSDQRYGHVTLLR